MSHSFPSPPHHRSLIAFAVLAALAGAPGVRAAGETTRVSIASDGTEAFASSFSPSVSASGRYVAFQSDQDNDNLVPGDTNGKTDVFIHDRQTGQTTRVSVASNGRQGNGDSYAPSVSADGRYVAFSSYAGNLVPGDTNEALDVFVHDCQTGQTTRVSVASDGTEGNAGSYDRASISADGRYVAFESRAGNLVPGDGNGSEDIFVHDRLTRRTTRVSVASDGAEGYYGGSFSPGISAGGRYVTFRSDAGNLVAGDGNGSQDVFVHDRQTGQTTRVSIASDGAEANAGSYNSPSVSADGRYVVFESAAYNLVAGDTNETVDIFVHDRQTKETTRVSVASDGTEGNIYSFYASLSADGRYVAFESAAGNLVPGDTNGRKDVFVHDRETRQTTRVSLASDGAQENRDSRFSSISADGRYAAFHSIGDLVPEDGNGRTDVFLRDRLLLAGKSADLAVSQKASPKSVGKGATLTYTLTLKNSGTDDATDVALTDILPDSQFATLLSVTPGAGGSCSKSPISVCRFETLKAGASATVTVKVKTKAKGTLTNTVSVSAAPTEPTPADNASMVTATVK